MNGLPLSIWCDSGEFAMLEFSKSTAEKERACRRLCPIAVGKATTMGHIRRGHLIAAKVIVPPPEVMAQCGKIIAPLFEQIINNALQSRTLAQLRDTLLPKLISGELRVKDAQAIAEATP